MPMDSSHPLGAVGQTLRSSTVLLRIEFTAAKCSHSPGELLPHLSTLTCLRQAVYLCCTCPEVAFGGRYPLSLPCGARTFLVRGLSAHLTRLPGLLTKWIISQTNKLHQATVFTFHPTIKALRVLQYENSQLLICASSIHPIRISLRSRETLAYARLPRNINGKSNESIDSGNVGFSTSSSPLYRSPAKPWVAIMYAPPAAAG